VFEFGDLIPQDGRSLKILDSEGGLEVSPGLGQLGEAIRLAILGPSAMVLQAGLDTRDGRQGLGRVGFVAGGATEAMDPLVVGPAEPAGGALAASHGGRDRQLQA
jgi:hypothetical protein